MTEKKKQVPEADVLRAKATRIHERMLEIANHVIANPDDKPKWEKGSDRNHAISNMNYDNRAQRILDIAKDWTDNYKMPGLIIDQVYRDMRDAALGGESMFTGRQPDTDQEFMDKLRALPDSPTKVLAKDILPLADLVPSYWGDEDNPDDEQGIYDGGDSSRDEYGNNADGLIFLLKMIDSLEYADDEAILKSMIMSKVYFPCTLYWGYVMDFAMMHWIKADIDHMYEKDYYVQHNEVLELKVLLEIMMDDLDCYYAEKPPRQGL